MLEKVFQDHSKWINTTKKFGCSKEEAQDIVGDMYCIIGKMLNKGLDISYGDSVNYFYIYRTLKTSFLQLKNRQTKENHVPINESFDHEEKHELTRSYDSVKFLESPEPIDFEIANNKILDALDNMHWYDKKIYNLIQYDYSITELHKKTGISYHSLYNTYRKVKQQLKELL